MLFSIIVPVYKVKDYLDRCVQSVLSQSFTDFELILVDDGSPDECGEMCDAWQQKDDRIKVVHKQNGGLSSARNAGIEVAKGEYVLFIDSDDYIVEGSLEKLSKFADVRADVLTYDGVTVGGNYDLNHVKKEEMLTGKEFLKESLLQNLMPMVACLNCIRRDFLIENELRFKEGIRHEDEEFTPRLFFKAQKVLTTGVDLYRYIIRDNSITTAKDLRPNARDLYQTLESLENMYIEVEDEEFKDLLLDSLATKYLSLFFVGKLYKYGKEFVKKDFVKRTAKSNKNRKKAKMFCFGPRIYCLINTLVKKVKRR